MKSGKRVDVELASKKASELVRFVRKNIKIGTVVKARVDRRSKNDYDLLTLNRIEGIHYIFISKFGWLQSYTLIQLCLDIRDGYITIMEGETNND